MTVVAQMVEYISTSLADSPQIVEVHESVSGRELMIDLKVAPEDMGRIIGRRGRHINAMRDLARVLAKKMDKAVDITLVEKE